jgi:arylsulfatase
VIDVMATCVDVAGGKFSKKFAGNDLIPLEGVSLRPSFSGESLDRKDALYFEHHLNCAIRDGDWKLVRKGSTGRPAKLHAWELYNMSEDRTERHNLAAKHPKKVAELNAKWEAWAARAKVKPWPWKFEGDR